MYYSELENNNIILKEDELPQVFYPWRRFLARLLDIFMYRMIWSIILIFVFHVSITTRSNIGKVFDDFITFGIMIFWEPLWLRWFGTTPGKAVFGLNIKAPEGRKLYYSEGLSRVWSVARYGMGYYLPIYCLVRLWNSYKICSSNETQPWDKYISYTIKDTKKYRSILWVGSCVTIIALLTIATSVQKFPPNRGNLTVSEFAENYNYYAKFLEIDFGNEFFNENGEWEVKTSNVGTYNMETSVEFGYFEMPEYNYTIENGYVTEVSFAVELENIEEWINTYDIHMILASLSFAGAQKEVSLFSNIPSRIIEQIGNSTFTNFNFIEAGIEFTSNTMYSGYIVMHPDYLFPDDNVDEYYFRQEFSMNKIK